MGLRGRPDGVVLRRPTIRCTTVSPGIAGTSACRAARQAGCGSEAGAIDGKRPSLARTRWLPAVRGASAYSAQQLPRTKIAAAAEPGNARLVLDRAPCVD